MATPAPVTAEKTLSARTRARPSKFTAISAIALGAATAAATPCAARAEQPPARVREPAEQGRGGEQRDPGGEGAAAAEHVPGAAAEQQQAAEREHVGVLDPGEAAGRQAESALHLRQRDGGDRGVQADHELSADDDGEDDSWAMMGGGGAPRSGGLRECGRPMVGRGQGGTFPRI
jgi:hypothetical protein